MNYDVDFFLAKFEAIPDEQWCVSVFHRVIEGVGRQCCAMGHCGASYSDREDGPEVAALLDLFALKGMIVTSINDGNDDRFKQETPKQRILSALREIKSLTPCNVQ